MGKLQKQDNQEALELAVFLNSAFLKYLFSISPLGEAEYKRKIRPVALIYLDCIKQILSNVPEEIAKENAFTIETMIKDEAKLLDFLGLK